MTHKLKEMKFLNEFHNNFLKNPCHLHEEDVEFLKGYYGILPDWAIEYYISEHSMITPSRKKKIVSNTFLERKNGEYLEAFSLSGGIGSHSYDCFLDKIEKVSNKFYLGSTVERFKLPPFIIAEVWNKSTNARMGICQPQTIIESGWEGWLTLEICDFKNYDDLDNLIGSGIVSIIFHKVLIPRKIYDGKYQNQLKGITQAK